VSGFFSKLAGWAIARRAAVVAATIFISLIGVASAARLDTDAGTSTLVDEDSDAFAATERFRELFGDEAIAVLVQGDLESLVLTQNLAQLLRLEGCLAGNLSEEQAAQAQAAQAQAGQRPRRPQPVPAPCDELAERDPVRVVYGPATFLNQAAAQAQRFLSAQARATYEEARSVAAAAAAEARRDGASPEEQRVVARAAAQQVISNFQGELLELAVRYGQTGLPQIDDPFFVRRVVFDSRLPGEPKARFAYLFPSAESALISIRLEPGLSGEERAAAIELIREAAVDPEFRLEGGSYVVSGVPVVVEELADEFRGEIFILLAAALAVMALVLTLVFGPPMRLLPLALALIAAAVAFGLLALAGGSLTMASIAVLPVLIGLAVDYAIQFQARHREAVATGAGPGRAARSATGRGGPVIATAAAATVAGFAVLLLSPVPMVRGFGILLVIGIAIALLAALTTGIAILTARRPRPRPSRGPTPRPLRPPRAERLAPRLAAIRGSIRRPLSSLGKRALAASITAPGRVLAIAVVLAVGGWVAGTRTDVISDLRELVPESVLADAGVDELQEETGVSGELNVLIDAPDITDPELIAWMADLKARILARGGFEGEFPSCEEARICPQISLTDLFGDEAAGGTTSGEVRTLLEAIPEYFSQAIVAGGPDEGADTANLAFGIRVMPLDEQKELVDAVREELDPPGTQSDPPPGVEARVAGLPVLAADANAELADSRYWVTIAGLLAVAIVLLAIYRSISRALVPLVPIVLATGWSALVIAATGIPLNPMSATLGALVIAIATEFSVILTARFREERERGRSVGEALRLTYARTGVAVLASGTTAIAGFAILALSGIRMLRDFGLVTVLDLGVALLGVMLVLPATLVWAETRAVRTPDPGRLRRRAAGLVPKRLRGVRGG
jgi:hydrophobe/amphiphile efflux-3 (HAE3) family protein